jgi:hypothetical protein
MARCTPTDAFSNIVSWRLDGPGALGIAANDLEVEPSGVAI